jgi:hypothetical protein
VFSKSRVIPLVSSEVRKRKKTSFPSILNKKKQQTEILARSGKYTLEPIEFYRKISVHALNSFFCT